MESRHLGRFMFSSTRIILCSATVTHGAQTDFAGLLEFLRAVHHGYHGIFGDPAAADRNTAEAQGSNGSHPEMFAEQMQEFGDRKTRVFSIDFDQLFQRGYFLPQMLVSIFTRWNGEPQDGAMLASVIPLLLFALTLRRIKYQEFPIDESGSFEVITEGIALCRTYTVEATMSVPQAIRRAPNHMTHTQHIRIFETGFAHLDESLDLDKRKPRLELAGGLKACGEVDDMNMPEGAGVAALQAHRTLRSISIDPSLGQMRNTRGYVSDTSECSNTPDGGYAALSSCAELDHFARPQLDALIATEELLGPSQAIQITGGQMTRP